MKNSKEMADSVFEIRDAYLEKQKKRRKTIKKATYVCSTVWVFALVITGVYLVNDNNYYVPRNNFEDNSVIADTTENMSSETPTKTAETDVVDLKTETATTVIPDITEFATETGTQHTSIAYDNTEDEPVVDTVPDIPEKEDIPQNIETPTDTPPIDVGVSEEIENNTSVISNWDTEQIFSAFPIIEYNAKLYSCANVLTENENLELCIDTISVKCPMVDVENDNMVIANIYSLFSEDTAIAVSFADRQEFIVYTLNQN